MPTPPWFTSTLAALAAAPDPPPSAVLAAGIRVLPPTHPLHALHYWSRRVFRPAAAPALFAVARAPGVESVAALSACARALLAGLVGGVAESACADWVPVLGAMVLADDAWSVEVGGGGADVERAGRAFAALVEQRAQLFGDVAECVTGEEGESFAELGCRIAALQIELDEVRAIVRENERHTKDLTTSFDFWAQMLLAELRSCRSGGEHAAVGRAATAPATPVQRQTAPPTLKGDGGGGGGSASGETGAGGSDDGRQKLLESFTNVMLSSPWSAERPGGVTESGGGQGGGEAALAGGSAPGPMEQQKPRRVFRNGRWVER